MWQCPSLFSHCMPMMDWSSGIIQWTRCWLSGNCTAIVVGDFCLKSLGDYTSSIILPHTSNGCERAHAKWLRTVPTVPDRNTLFATSMLYAEYVDEMWVKTWILRWGLCKFLNICPVPDNGCPFEYKPSCHQHRLLWTFAAVCVLGRHFSLRWWCFSGKYPFSSTLLQASFPPKM